MRQYAAIVPALRNVQQQRPGPKSHETFPMPVSSRSHSRVDLKMCHEKIIAPIFWLRTDKHKDADLVHFITASDC